MIFILEGDGVKIINNKNLNWEVNQSIILGVIENPFDIIISNPIRCIVIDFNPVGFFELFNVSGNEISNKILRMKDALGFDLNSLVQELSNRDCIYKLIKILDALYVQNINTKKANNPLSSSIINLFHTPFCMFKFARIFCSSNLSLRYFEKKFKEQVGVTPVKYKRIIRANLALEFILLGENKFDIINKLNFYDQAHFIKEFKWFTGFTPMDLKSKLILPMNFGMSHLLLQRT